MAKKDIENGLDALFGNINRNPNSQTKEETTGRKERPGKSEEQTFSCAKKVKTSLQLETEQYDKVKHIAKDNNLNINEIVNIALKSYISRYEEKYGQITTNNANKRNIDI